MGVPKRTRDYYVNLNNSEPSCLKKERRGGGQLTSSLDLRMHLIREKF